MIVRVRAIRTSFENAPERLLALGCTRQSRVALTEGAKYAVYGLSVWRGDVGVLVIDDDDLPRVLPTWIFDEVDASIPVDWVCSFFEGEVAMVLGPAFIAGSVEAYTDLVELVPDQVHRFREYVQSLANDDRAVV